MMLKEERKICKEFDNVESPRHYTAGNIECIDAMIEAYGSQAVQHFCLCNAFKYLWRCENKNNQIEDLRKANWYINKFIKLKQDENNCN